MKILLRTTEEGKVVALHPEDGTALTRIRPAVWCDNDNLSTAYEHPGGIYWNDIKNAVDNIDGAGGHEIVSDDDPTV